MFKVEIWLSVIFERQCLVFFGEQRDFDDPGIDDLINEEPSPISGTRVPVGQDMSEAGAGIRTRPSQGRSKGSDSPAMTGPVLGKKEKKRILKF